MSKGKWIIAAAVAYFVYSGWRGITDAMDSASNPEGNRYG